MSPDHPSKRRVWDWMRKASGYAPITIPYCRRGWIALDERDLIQKQVFDEGFYEPEVWEALFSFASHTEVLWDVGAHVGTFSIRCMLDPRVAEVHAFEPDPVTLRALELNVRLNNGLGSPCSIHNMAIGADSGYSILHRGPVQNIGLSSIALEPSDEVYGVYRTSIDELIFQEGLKPPSLIKIDVEGAEAALVLGAKQLLQKRNSKAIVIEAEANPDGAMKDDSIAASLIAAGYRINRIQRPGGALWPRENYLAVLSAPRGPE